MIDMHAAYKLRRADSPLRWELEARILAREGVRSVARKTGIAPDTIRAYAAVFFNVQSRINSRDYIHSVIGSWKPWTPTRVRDLWCHLAYTGGPFVLDAVIQHYRQSGHSDYAYLMEPLGPERSQSDLERSINRLLRVMLLHTNQANMAVLATTLSDLAATDRELGQPLADELFAANLDKAVDEALATIPIQETDAEPARAPSGAA